MNTNNVNDMDSIFNNCKSLNSLPDISKWNTTKATAMNSIFYGCKSLNSLPDIVPNFEDIHESLIKNLSKINNYISNKKNENILVNNYDTIFLGKTNFHFVCKDCNRTPEITFINNFTLTVECDCGLFKNSKLELFIEKYINCNDLNKKNQEENYCRCKFHLMKISAYCIDCHSDLCEKCVSEDGEKHLTHTTFRFSDFFDSNKDIIYKYIIYLKDEIEKGNELKAKLFVEIIELIYSTFRYYPCFDNYLNLDNMIKYFCENINDRRKITRKDNDRFEFFKKINNRKELKYFLKDYPDKINKIISIIIQTQNFYDLNLLKTNDFQISYDKLNVLDLRNNNINDVSPLISIKFPELKNLNLSLNRLSDKSIHDICNLCRNLPKLTILSLSSNAFTKYEILKCVKNCSNLKVFDISNNFLLCDLKKSDMHNDTFNLKNIEILNFSGIFSNKSIELLKNLEFEYLKKINLNSNNLNSVKFFEKMNCINLEELSLINNNIKEFYVFIKFKKLKIINLKQNKISSISKLNEFLEELPDIEKINISDNLIDLNSSENEEIIEISKEKRNSNYQKIKIII